ncbi:MAG: tetratricopeptide repeat protein, partial [Cyanobacteria bacterium J06629_9]
GKQRDRLWQAEADAKNIGNATQFINLGNILFDMRETERAYEAYQQALEKEPKNEKALWGASQSAGELSKCDQAKAYLEQLLSVNPEFSYGEASLSYGELLYQMKDYAAATAHLEKHLKSWSSPEGYLMLADIQASQQKADAARETLETLIIKIKGYVPFQYRKNAHYIRKAEQKLKTLKA